MLNALPQEIRVAIGLFMILAVLTCVGWIFWRTLRASPDPARLVFRWLLTAGLIAGFGYVINGLAGGGDPMGQIAGVLVGLVLGLLLAIVWVPAIISKVSESIGSLYTGGSEPPTPTPVYSIAQARRKQGRPNEAIIEIQKQLQQFPTDVTGQMMLAEIQAEDLKDLLAVEATMEGFLTQDHAPRNIAYALNSLADWRLKLGKDRDGARQALERIGELLPDTPESQNAAQRIAHLITPEEMRRRQEANPITLPTGIRDLGLQMAGVPVTHPDQEAEANGARLCAHLADHPLDREAREKLAHLYADDLGRLDEGIGQLEYLAQLPNQTPREVAKWIHRVADLQVRQGADYEIVRVTLQRIVDQFPGLAPAELAQQRIERIRLELKGREKGQIVAMGEYEKDVGLRVSRPPDPSA